MSYYCFSVLFLSYFTSSMLTMLRMRNINVLRNKKSQKLADSDFTSALVLDIRLLIRNMIHEPGVIAEKCRELVTCTWSHTLGNITLC